MPETVKLICQKVDEAVFSCVVTPNVDDVMTLQKDEASLGKFYVMPPGGSDRLKESSS